MKMILVALIALMFVACSTPETQTLKKENADLKTQLETITKERDALKVQLDSIKAVLENATGSTNTTPDTSTPTTPDSSTATSTTPTTPDSSMDSGNSSADPSTPATAPSSTPSSDGSGASTPASSGTQNVSAIEMYAKEVLETAQKYNTETQQTPPADCSSGYTAGTHAVPSSDAVQSCRVDRVDNGFKVTLKDANGAITTYPTP